MVLRGVDLELPAGESLALRGANGAGKTTLLRIIATLLRPTSGSGTVDGLDLLSEPGVVRARTAYVSARGFLYDDLTAVENLSFTARMAGVSASSDDIAGLLGRAGLLPAREQPIRTFSTGMRRRLALVSILVRPVRLALIDEPYAGLDEDGAALADEIVRDLLAAGTTVIVASHQAGDATRAASVSLRLDNGRLA